MASTTKAAGTKPRSPGGEPHVVVIGAGLGGLASAAYLAKRGYRVTVVEKNEQCGGHAGVIREQGYTFDTSPLRYTQHELYVQFFAEFGKKPEDYYRVKQLEPTCRVFFTPNDILDIATDLGPNLATFEDVERGGGARFKRYIADVKRAHDLANTDLFPKSRTPSAFITWLLFGTGRHLHFLQTASGNARRALRSNQLRRLAESATLFIGGDPRKSPAAYGLIAQEGIYDGGTMCPHGGMSAVALGMERLCKELGVTFKFMSPVRQVLFEHGRAAGVETAKSTISADAIISNADYAHTELSLLDPEHRDHSAQYWKRRTLATSGFVLYLGITKKLSKLKHRNLYLASDWKDGLKEIFESPAWPERPSYSIHVPSVDDPSAAPKGCETLIVFVPTAYDLDDDEAERGQFEKLLISHLEAVAGETFADDIAVKRVWSQRDFAQRYNSFQGTAFGLAPTLTQSGPWRFPQQSKKSRGLYYAGRYIYPGFGAALSLTAGKEAAELVHADLQGRPRRLGE